MADKGNAIYARAVIDFDKQHSIKQVRDISKHAEKILSNISKTGKNNLTPLNEAVGIYGTLVKKGKEYKELLFQIGKGAKKYIGEQTVSSEYMKDTYGVDFNKLEKLVEQYTKLVDKAKAFNDLVAEMKNSAKDGKTISATDISKAMASYEKVYAEFTKNQLDTSEIDANAQYLEDYENNYKSVSKRLSDIINSTLTPTEKLHFRLKELRAELEGAEEEFLALGIAGESTAEAEDNIRRIRKEITKLEKGLKLTPLQKLINTIKRVGFYRIARNLFKIIEHGFMDGINALIEFDDRADKTFSSIARSFEIIRSSIALIALPLTEMVAPKFEDIAYAVADFAEGVSRASAALSGMAEYTKINRNYLKSLRDEANKTNLSFDKFESLDAKDSIFETGKMTPEEMDEARISTEAQALKSLKDILNVVWELAKSVGSSLVKVWKALEPHLDTILEVFTTFLGILAEIVIWIAQISAKFFDWAAKNGILEESIKGIIIVIAGLKLTGLIANLIKIGGTIKDITKFTGGLGGAIQGIATIGLIFLVKEFFDMILKDAPPVIKVIFGVVTALLAVAGAIWAIKSGGNPFALGMFAIGAGGLIASLSAITKDIPQYKNGGLVDSGSLFIAGEAGAELVTTMPSGHTGVTNIAQFKQATLEALYAWWDEAKYDLPEGNSFNIDGAQIARSKSFIAEMNRRNTGLGLK